VNWYYNGYLVASVTGQNASTWSNLIISGYSTASGNFQNLGYITGSTWLAPGGVTGTSASWTNNNTTVATAAGQYAGWAAGYVPNAVGATATFGSSIGTTNQTITLDGNQTVGQLTFANSTYNGGNYTIAQGSGGTLTLNNSGVGAVITNYYGNNVISAPISLADNVYAAVATGTTLTLAGAISDTGGHGLVLNYGAATAGSLIISGAANYGGVTTVAAGALFVTSSGSLSGAGAALTVGANAVFNNFSTGAPTFNVATMNLGTNSVVGMNFGGGIAASGTATVDPAAVNLSLSGSFISGHTYTLLAAAGGGLSGGGYAVWNPTFNYALNVSNTAVTITPTTATPLAAYYWLGGLSSNSNVWAASNGTITNWSDGNGNAQPLVPGAGVNAIFSDPSASASTQVNMVLGANMAMNSLKFSSSNPVNVLSAGYTLTLGSTTGAGITLASGVGTVALLDNIALGIAQTWGNNSTSTLTVGSVNNAGYLLTIGGTGSTTIAGPLTGAGGLTVSGGSVTLANSSTAYTGPTLVTGGTLNVPISITSSSSVAVNGGTLQLNGGVTGAVSVVGGTLAGAGTTGAVTVTSGTIAPGFPTTPAIGTLSTGNVSLASGSDLDFVLGSPGFNSLLAVGGTLTLPTGAGSIVVNLINNSNNNNLGGPSAGVYAIATYTTLMGGNATFNNTFTIGTNPGIPGVVYSFANTGATNGAINLTLASTIPLNYVDTFNRSTTFNGSAPTLQNGSSNTWVSTTSLTTPIFSTSTSNGGILASTGNVTGSAWLPISTPSVNSVYTYTVEVNVTGAPSSTSTNWAALGFATSAVTNGGPNQAADLAWMLLRYTGNPQYIYNGNAAVTIPTTSPAYNIAGAVNATLSLVLDTRPGLVSATAYWLIDGWQVATATGINASQIANLVIGSDDVTSTYQNLTYASGSYWLAPGGTTGTNASWNNNNVATAAAAATISGWAAGFVPNAVAATATFGPSIGTVNSTITLDGGKTVGQLLFANSTYNPNGAGNYTIAQGSGGALTLNNSGNGAVIYNYYGNNTISAPISLADNVFVSASAGTTLTLSGGITDTGAHSLTLNFGGFGSGALILTGSNSYGGSTSVGAGTLTVANSGALTATGTSLTVSAGAAFNDLSTSNPTFSVGTLTLGHNSTIGLDFGGKIAASGAATVDSTLVNLSLSGSFTSGNTYTLLTASGGLSSAGYVVWNPTFTYTLGVTSTAVAIKPTSTTQLSNAYWLGGLTNDSSVWAASNNTITNWSTNNSGAAVSLVPGASTNAYFADNNATAATQVNMTLGANMAINSLNFITANPVSLLNTGNTLTLGSTTGAGITMSGVAGSVNLGANITLGVGQSWTNNSSSTLTVGNVNTNSYTLTVGGTGNTLIAGVVSGTGGMTVNPTGGGVVTLSFANTYSGATSIASGTLNLVAASIANSATTINGGTLTGTGTTGTVTLTAGTLAPGSATTPAIGTLNTGALSIAAGTTLDFVLGSLGNNSEIAVNGALTLPTAAASVTVNLINNNNNNGLGIPSSGGVYTLATYTSLSGGNATFNNTFVPVTPPILPPGVFLSFANTGTGAGALQLIVAADAAVNPVYYQDTFNRTTTFSGSAPTIRNGNTGTWTAETTYTTSTTGGGQLAVSSTTQYSSLLPIATPVAGNVYTLSVYEIAAPNNSTNWLTLGFANSAAVDSSSPTQAGDLAWILFRSAAGSPQFFYGGGTANGTSIAGVPGVSMVGAGTVAIVLNTQPGLTNSTIYWMVDGYQVASTTGINASSYAQLIIGNSIPGTFENFTYASGSYWLAPGGTTGTSASWNNNTTATATAATQVSGWSAGLIPNAAGATATFGASIGAVNSTITLDGNKTVGQLTFANSTYGGGNYTIAPGSGGTLTLNNNGLGAVITNYWGNNTISVPISLADNLYANISTGSSLTISGAISDTGSHGLAVNFLGTAGTLILANSNNAYLGGTVVSNGNLQLGNGTAGNNGAVVGSIKLSPSLAVSGATPGLVFDPYGSASYSNSITGAGTVTMTGAGAVTLTGANTFTGATTVAGGTLTLSGSGTLAGTSGLTVASGGTFNYVGTSATLNLPTLSLSQYSTVGVTVGKTVASAGAASVSGAVSLSLSGTVNFNTPYTALTAASGLSGGTYFVANPTYTYSLSATDTAVTITPTAPVSPLTTAYWIGGVLSGNPVAWAVSSGSATNWTTDGNGTVAAIPPSAVTNVIFSDSSAGFSPSNQVNMALGANMAVNSLTFNTTNQVSLQYVGNTLTIGSTTGAGMTVSVGAGQVSLNENIALGIAQSWTNNSTSNTLTIGNVNNAGYLLTIAGPGSTTIGGAISGAGGLTVSTSSGGVVTLSALNSFSGLTTVSSGAILNVTGTIANSSASVSGTLNLSAGSVGAVAINGGTLNLSGTTAGVVTITGGGTLTGTGATGPVTLTSGTIAPGSPTGPTSPAIGALTTGALNIAAGTTLDFVLGSAGYNSSITAGGQLTLPTSGSPIVLDLFNNNNNGGLGSIGVGSYLLASYNSLSGGVSDFNQTFTVVPPAGFTGAYYTVSNSGVGAGNVYLNITTGVPSNPVYMLDTFNRTTTFSGSAPTIQNGNTGTWTASTGFTTSTANGGTLSSSTTSVSAIFPRGRSSPIMFTHFRTTSTSARPAAPTIWESGLPIPAPPRPPAAAATTACGHGCCFAPRPTATTPSSFTAAPTRMRQTSARGQPRIFPTSAPSPWPWRPVRR